MDRSFQAINFLDVVERAGSEDELPGLRCDGALLGLAHYAEKLVPPLVLGGKVPDLLRANVVVIHLVVPVAAELA